MAPEIRLLAEVVEHAFRGRGWHGTTLTGALRGVSPTEALWRPGAKRHNIWELVLHAAYWKYAVRRRLVGSGIGGFPRSPSNWPAIPTRPDAAQWRADVRLLGRTHNALLEAVEGFPVRRLRARAPGRKWTYRELIHGVAAHDLYHTGQIQLIKRLRTRK
jgi:uncharacterized damage-inducible protein DinB